MKASKRLLDIGVSLLLLLGLLPLFAIVSALILLTDGRPIFFVSERMITPDRGFSMFKFRTMRWPKDQGRLEVTNGSLQSRVTPIGRLLRRTRLDELPQLINVVRGELSLVGPRPPLRQIVEKHGETYSKVLRSRPGITGLASLVFSRHEELVMRDCEGRADAEEVYARRCIPRKVRLDLIYQSQQSTWLDVWLLFNTALRFVPGDLLRVPFRPRRMLRGLWLRLSVSYRKNRNGRCSG